MAPISSKKATIHKNIKFFIYQILFALIFTITRNEEQVVLIFGSAPNPTKIIASPA